MKCIYYRSLMNKKSKLTKFYAFWLVEVVKKKILQHKSDIFNLVFNIWQALMSFWNEFNIEDKFWNLSKNPRSVSKYNSLFMQCVPIKWMVG